MKNKFLLILLLLVILTISSVIILFNYCSKIKNPKQVCFKSNCFYVEIATTTEEKNRGLMFRENLDADKGMFFIFRSEGKYSFWMKNVLIPLDIIWINANQEVVFISKNSQPCIEEYSCFPIDPKRNAKYILEVNGGIVEQIELNIGDKVDFLYPQKQ
jgi:uncharacterized membrane protein (UPF0127 family)